MPENKLFYTVAEVSNRCGWSRPTTYRLIRENELPAVKVTGSLRVPARAFDQWLDTKVSESFEGGSENGR